MSTLEKFNGRACCLLGLCCLQGSVEQRKALMTAAKEEVGQHDTPEKYVQWILNNFALVPKGGDSLLKTGFDMGVRHAKAKA